jgi:hypothetical protein
MERYTLKLKWGTSRARDSEGYTLCTLYSNGEKMARECGGNYDLAGSAFGTWVQKQFKDRLLKLTTEHRGLKFFDPDFDPDKAEVPGTGKTVLEREQAGDSVGLERYQAVHRSASPVPTERHVVPYIDGAYGWDAVASILEAVGGTIRKVGGDRTSKEDWYEVEVKDGAQAAA